MTDEKKEAKPDNYIALSGGCCEDCRQAISNDDYTAMDDETEARVRAGIERVGQWLIVGEAMDFSIDRCAICDALPGDRWEVGYLDEDDEDEEDEDETLEMPEDEADEPEEEDLVTYDDKHFYSVGSHSTFDVRLKRNCAFIVEDDEDRDDAIRAYMDKTQFWPNAWSISDHGNAHRIDLSKPAE